MNSFVGRRRRPMVALESHQPLTTPACAAQAAWAHLSSASRSLSSLVLWTSYLYPHIVYESERLLASSVTHFKTIGCFQTLLIQGHVLLKQHQLHRSF